MVGTEAERHDVPAVAGVDLRLLARLDVPEGAGHVPARCHYLVVIEESAARQVAEILECHQYLDNIVQHLGSQLI